MLVAKCLVIQSGPVRRSGLVLVHQQQRATRLEDEAKWNMYLFELRALVSSEGVGKTRWRSLRPIVGFCIRCRSWTWFA